jgi:hypothetical protein
VNTAEIKVFEPSGFFNFKIWIVFNLQVKHRIHKNYKCYIVFGSYSIL